LGLTQPRLNDLLRGKIDKFSLDALFDLTGRVEQQKRKIKGTMGANRMDLRAGLQCRAASENRVTFCKKGTRPAVAPAAPLLPTTALSAGD
jgi:helix-turn-helix protein